MGIWQMFRDYVDALVFFGGTGAIGTILAVHETLKRKTETERNGWKGCLYATLFITAFGVAIF